MKKLILIALVFVIAFVSFFNVPNPAFAEVNSIRKVVSVVYDDSGSMKGDKWAYANYAMQAFCGMLNSEDVLYITYMSRSGQNEYITKDVDLTSKGIQSSIDSIRAHSKSSNNTPFGAVQKAFDKLKSAKDTDKNTQYWLLVITDGEFDEFYYLAEDAKKTYINEKLRGFAGNVMPNGSYPQITFMAIGDNVVSPDDDAYKGIYTYSANSADKITSTMSEMADRISSRTRLSPGSIKQLDSKTIQVSSTIPLLNIAVLSQGSVTKVSKATDGKKKPISVVREATLDYPGYEDLIGGAYLLANKGKTIRAGTYKIVFDKEVNVDDVVILFEPALETRMFVKTGENDAVECRDTENIPAGENVSVSFKVYETGTDNEIKDSDLPEGTKFSLTVSENGNLVAENKGNKKEISEYCLKNSETEFSSSVIIEGFNPIEQSLKVKPGKNVQYKLTSEFGGKSKSIKLDSLAGNKDMTVCFTITADGKPITDPDVVKTFSPAISVSPAGNSGTTSYSKDGKIVFTPNATGAINDDIHEVDVKCTLENGVSASEKYTVVVSQYEVKPVGEAASIRKTELYENSKGVSFYITQNGVKLKKSEVENKVSALADVPFEKLELSVTVADDGKVTVVPFSKEKHQLSFRTWWFNWVRYFRLPDGDMNITLMHSYASGNAAIKVIGAPAVYQILNVYLPLFIELVILSLIIAYIIRYFTKARFADNAVLYVGSIVKPGGRAGVHLMDLHEIELKQYNKFKNLRNPFKELTVYVSGLSITAAKGNMIICNEAFPWYSDFVKPKSKTILIQSPKDIVNYCQEKDDLMITEIKTARVMDEQNRLISQDDTVYYFVKAEVEYERRGYQQTEVIDNAVVFCYSAKEN